MCSMRSLLNPYYACGPRPGYHLRAKAQVQLSAPEQAEWLLASVGHGMVGITNSSAVHTRWKCDETVIHDDTIRFCSL